MKIKRTFRKARSRLDCVRNCGKQKGIAHGLMTEIDAWGFFALKPPNPAAILDLLSDQDVLSEHVTLDSETWCDSAKRRKVP